MAEININENRKWLYDALTGTGVEMGTYEEFDKNADVNKDWLYSTAMSKGIDIGDYDAFDKAMGYNQAPVASAPVSGQTEAEETPSVVPQQRPSLHEQVDKSQIPVMEDLPWMKNTGGQNGMLSADNLGDRLEEAYKRGDFEPFRHREEDARIRNEYTPRQVVNEADIMENAKNRFALTERGQELGNEFASIRKEKTDRYLEELKNSDEYKAIVSRKPETQEEADAVNNAINELFSQKYGARLEEEMQPYNDAYHNEVLSRYGAEIKTGLTKLGKKSTSEQVAGLTEEVNALLEKEHEVLKQHGGSGNNAMNALMGSAQYNQATGERRKEIGALESAHKLLENSREIINEAGKAGNTNFAAGLIRGARDNFDADKWTFGLAEMADAKYLNNALEKSARGETLTPAEEKLLDASTINMATQAYFSSDLGRGYKAGSVTAESLPFMLEFLVNPISGSGNTIAKGLLKYGLKRFGSVASTKGARIAGRMIGDSAAALGMEGTTGIGRVAAGTLDRLNQNYETSFNDDGEVEVKQTDDMGIGEALARSGASTFLENQSEMIFNAFRTGGKAATKAIADAAPGMSEKTANRIIDFYNKVRNNKTLKSVSDRAQFHGLLEEYGEEVYNNMANVAIGEMSAEDAFDVDNNIDTFLGLAPTSLAFATLGIGGLVSENIQAKKRLRKFVENLNEEGREIFSELWDEIEKGHDNTAKAFVKRTLTDESLSAEEKKDRIFSVRDMINARNTEQEIGEAENETVVATEEVPIPAIDKVNVYRNFKRAERKVAQLLPSISEEMLNSITDVDKFAADNNLNDAQKAVVADYVSAREPFGAYLSDTNTRRDAVKTDARERASADIDKIINKDNGFVIQAKHKSLDNPVYIERGNLVFDEDGLLDKEKTSEIVYYRDENGDIIPASPDKFDSILSQNTKDELVAEAEAQADADFVAQEEESLASPDIPVPERGVTVAIKGENYLIEGSDEDNPGNVLAYKLDANGEIDKQEDSSQVLSLSPDEYYSAKEAELWNNDEQTADVASPETKEMATDIPVSEIRETGTGEVADTAQGINTSDNQPRNESSPEAEESKVSEVGQAQNSQEETPEQRMQRIIDSLPKKKDGKIDYKVLTPRQQYDYTSVTESEEVAASDLREEISAREKELKKMNERLTKVTGGERAEVRDAIREHRTALDELQSFYNTIAPASVEQQAEAQDNSIPNDLRTDEDYISWVADNSDDVKEIADAYAASKELASHEQTLKPWQRELLGRRISSDSFNRFGDRNHITGGLAKAWLRKDGEEMDTLAQELSTFGGEVTEQDIVDFILANPSNRVSQISDDMRNLSRRFSEIASKELGFPVGGPESNTGKLYLQLKEAKAQVDNLTDAQKGQFVQAVAIDMDDADRRRADGYYESLGDYAQQYDRFRNELDAESADKALIQMMEDNLPQLYHGGFTADELDDIYSQIENNNGAERQAEDSRENQSPVSGEEVERYEESGTPEVVATENSEGEEQNSGVALNLEDNSVSLQEDNQKVNENDEISESIPQGEHGTETSQDGGLEEALAECRRRSSQDERYAQANSGTLSERERKEIENRAAENYAKEKGVWIPMQKVFSLGVPAPSGNENDVYLDTKDNSVYKVNNLMNSGNVTSLLERLKFHNEYFPDTKYELVGFSGFENGDVFPVLKQRYIEGADFATPEDIDGYMRSLGFKQRDEATYSNGDVTISDLRPRNVLKDADGDIYVIDADFKKESGFAAPSINPGENVLDYAERISREKGMHDVRRSVNTNPTEAQKEAGNYKKGHLKLDGYNITIENPKGSVRSGTDANGQAWSVTMNNDYGYIRGTKAVDGDHIDIFLSDTPMEGNVFVVDQNKEDGTFDESKVMYGFASAEDARTAYLSNYSSGWENRIGAITEVSKDEFKKWVSSSVRKTKPFADYKSVALEDVQSENQDESTENSISSPEISSETVANLPKSEITTENKKRSDNRLVTDERYEELKQRMKRKLGGQMNMGIDPEILAIGTEMAVYHLEKGARRFSEYATAMIADLGDVIRPYLKAFYNGARNLPEVENSEIAADMTPYDEVRAIDVANFDKSGIDALATAETVTREAEVEQEVEIAQERIKKSRSPRKKSEKKAVNLQQSNKLDLFDGLIDNETNNENGLQRTDAERSDRVSANGNRHEQGLSGGTETDSESEQQDSRGTDNGGERTSDAVDRTVRPRLSDTLTDQSLEGKRKKEVERNRKLADELKGVTLHLHDKLGGEREISGIVYYELSNVFLCNDNVSGPFQATRKELDAILKVARKSDGKATFEPKNTHNNHSERGKDHAPTSVDARIEANIKAIELSKQLLESGEKATEKQMQTLRKFSGWGGLGKAFSDGTYYAPDNIAKKLRELLGEKAYQEAVMSANSAYYTPAYVVDTLWDIAEKMGFEGGNILEGSAGIGNILGQMPTHISERSNIHAIEIDGTSGSILSLLYPDANVEIQGFEQTHIANGSVDLAITNVPFVTGLRVNDTTGDKDLSKKFHNIHDFCIAKNVRKLREGGLGIFITSNGTLDSSKKLRDWIVSEGGADFVGAFRMHNKTFGGTGVTSDIVVIRKRVNGQKSANAIDVSTVTGERMAEYDTGETRKKNGKETPVIKQLSMDYNRYFIEHPENMAGEMHFAFEKGDTFRPTSKGLYPKQDKKQEQMLAEFVQSFSAEEFGERSTNAVTDVMSGKKIGEMFVKDGKLYINSTASAQLLEVNANKVKGHTKIECFEAYTAIKEALAEVLAYQTENESDEGLKPLLDKLNKAYDDFVDTYGHFNKNTAIAFLRNDVDYASVFALEKYEETGYAQGKKIQQFGKTDVFSRRVVEKEKEPTPTNVKDGIIASIFKFGRVNVPYIAEQLGTGIEDVKKEIIESGYGFENPATRQIEASYQYLSGNVREKLRQAEENNENRAFDRNIKALQEVMPMEIPAHLIDFTLGSSWIDPKLYEEFVKERTEVAVQFTAVGGTWFMKEPYSTSYEKNRAMGVTSEMLGRTIMGHTLIEAAINNRNITVSTIKKNWDGSTETITDKEATQACAAKIDEIRQDFKDWARQKMQNDPEMSALIERIYNDTFNNFVPMSIPDEFVPKYFGGASHKFKMRPHQGRAIVRGTQQPLLLAHEVGTGKTFTLISTAMEMRRLGTAGKPMIVVQNATVGQFVASAKELYPNAKILTLEEADRSAEGRKNFYAKIRYNDWDMIVVPQSTFEFIPDSEEREMAFVQDKIEEKMLILEKMKEEDPDGKNMITRQAEREIELLEEQLAGLADNASKKRTANDEKKRAVALQNAEVKAMEMLDRRTDDVENFDDMGIDALLVDEAHEYKHLGFATAMQRGVKGVDPSYSKKSQGVFLKTQAVLEKNNGRNVIFATGTPISNTAAEIWTFMRYLMPADTMKEYGIYYFDDFVRNFGNIQQMLEFTTSGKFKENNRFAGYVNLPELVRIWSGVSDTVLTKEAGGVKEKIPEMEGGKAQDLYLPQTRALRSIMKFVKSELEHYEQMSGKEKKENSHIPLTMYGIAKAAAVDARLVQSDAEDDPNSKTNEAVRQTLRSLKETADYKGTVAIFADNYQNKQSGFNLYDDIRDKLIAEGVPADEIVVMRSGMTVKKKLEIFEKVNRGEVRVILGSTFTLGTGVNIQERLHTLIHLDAPNRPMDYTQRNGRILRQGNLHKDMNKPVRILRFGVEDSLDVTAYQRLKTKGAIADSIMNGKQMMTNSMTNRVLEEEEDVFGDTVAQLSGSEYAMLKNNAEKNVRKYASRKKQWETDQTYIHNAKPRLKAFIKDAEKRIEDNGRYLEAVRSSFPDEQFKEIVIGKHRFVSVDTMDDFFKEHNKSVLAEMKQMKDGEIAGEQKRELTIKIGDFSFVVATKLTRQTMRDSATLFNDVERKMTYSCPELGIEDVPVRQNLLRNAIEDITVNVITGKDFAERANAGERSKKHNEAELKELLSREGKPFDYEEELAQAKSQLEEYAELMKKELEEKEAKYAEMDASVEAANDITNADEDDVLYRSDDTMYRIREDAALNVEIANDYRNGIGAYTDDEVSYENDPVAKLLGQSRRTAKQRRKFAQRERQRMAERVESLAEKLHLDNVEVITDASVLEGKKQRAKGFYSKSTGKITIVIPNHTSTFDVEQALLHEAVAHYGLRKLFGEHFDTFLDNVFNTADETIRKRIVDMAAKNGWDFRKATEEYLASLAEKTEFENVNASWWRQIKDFFLNMLHKIGFEDFRGVTLTDNELRYILWRSYENLAEPGRYRSILGEATDIAMQYELKVGNYAMPNHINVAIASDDTLFRDATEDTNSDSSIERYEEELNTRAFKAKEAYQDSMLALKKLQDVIVKKSGKELKSFEDAYTAENHLSSKNTAEVESYGEHFFRPIIDAIGELMNNGITYEDIKRYVFAKHGLERNEVFAQRDAHNATIERFWKEKEQLERQYSKGKLMEDEYEEMKQSLQQKEHDFYEQQYQENRLRDYSGLTTLTGEKDEYEKISQEIVEEFEKSNDTSDLWKAINNATKETLKKTYECGLINKGTYEKVKSQFKYYIPLRGWNEKTAEDVYEYLQSETSPVNATLKTAKGRMSLADDPFATIGNMAESSIFMSNRNLMKQRFMNMVLNHPSDVVSLSEAWYVRDASTGDWVLSSPDIQEKDIPEEIRRKIEEHEDRMQELAKDGDATKVKEGLNINYRISDRQAHEHMIVVKRNGKEYVMYINGNPRAAQAINGLTNPNVNEHPVWKWIGNVNRQLAANFTTRNPAFVATNLSRDLIYSVFSTYIKEGTVYGNKFIGNIPKAMRVVARNLWGKGGNSPEDIYFKEYLTNGGETGYANLKDVEAYKKFVKKEIGKITGKKDYLKYLKACASFFSLMNRWAENVSRFNAYMTSREMGKNIFDSVSDAKEVTVNFNKKGAGYKTKGVFGLTSGTFKELFLFFNAAVQSLNNFSKIAVNHKSGFIKMVGGFTTAGFIIPALNTLATSMLGGDDDYYNNLPEWVRRNNICVYVGSGKFITIPLPIELRAFYGLGEMAYQETIGRGHGGKRIVYDAINQITELLPINPLGNNGDMVSSFTPDIAKPFTQLIRNKDYTGKPIYKENPFNQYMPEWTKTYNGTSKWLKSLSEWANDITGGNKYKRGWMNVNPAKVEHLFESYFGGMAKTINQASNTLIAGVESVIDSEKSEDLIWRNAPVLNRFVSDGSDDRTAFSKVNSRYYELYDIYVDVKHQLNGYNKEISSGNFSYLEELSELQNSKEYDIYKVFEQYRKSMDELKKLEKSFHNSNKDGRREIEKDIVNIKKKIIENIDGE